MHHAQSVQKHQMRFTLKDKDMWHFAKRKQKDKVKNTGLEHAITSFNVWCC